VLISIDQVAAYSMRLSSKPQPDRRRMDWMAQRTPVHLDRGLINFEPQLGTRELNKGTSRTGKVPYPTNFIQR